MAIMMYHSKEPRRVEPIGPIFTLEDLIYLVGEGCIAIDEIAIADQGMVLIVDKFAMRSGKPRNHMASMTAQGSGREIRGNAVLVGYTELGRTIQPEG